MLVKVSTGVEEVSAASYMRQLEEIFRRESSKTSELTHPEAFIRARAVRLWSDGDTDADTKVAAMIEGRPALNELDLLAQRRVSAWTRRLLDVFLSRKVFQTEPMLAHARLFFDGYAAPASPVEDTQLEEDMKTDDAPLRDYFCYLLLDFATADRELEELPLAAALVLSGQLKVKDRFRELAAKELRLRKKQLDKLDQQKHELLAKADHH
jgi:hypothetical protein